jgi:hypothetical protein
MIAARPPRSPHRLRAGSRLRVRWGTLALLVSVSTAATPTMPMPVPPDVQVLLVPKVLEFERGLSGRPGDELVIGVAYQPGFRESLVAMESLLAAARAQPEATAHGRRLRWLPVPITTGADLIRALPKLDVDVLYFAPMRAVPLDRLATAAGDRRLISVTGVPAYVHEGVIVGFGERGGRPRIMVNLEAARSAGVNFSAQLLQLADISETP